MGSCEPTIERGRTRVRSPSVRIILSTGHHNFDVLIKSTSVAAVRIFDDFIEPWPSAARDLERCLESATAGSGFTQSKAGQNLLSQ